MTYDKKRTIEKLQRIAALAGKIEAHIYLLRGPYQPADVTPHGNTFESMVEDAWNRMENAFVQRLSCPD